MSWPGLEPVLSLLSALASLPAARYYARALGAAAVRPVRGAHGRISRLVQDPKWRRTLVAYLGGTALAAAAVFALNMAFGRVAVEEAALGAVLVAVRLPLRSERSRCIARRNLADLIRSEGDAMNCPVCRDVALAMTERQGVEIDYCPKCRGVWLDRGELDKIIEKSFAQQGAPSPAEPRHDEHSGAHHGYRRKSWLSDIFD